MTLKRSLSLPVMTFYGLGTILGAGVYALVGEVAKKAALFTPLAFLLASVIAFFTGACYAELCSRFPQSAGSALYVRKGFNNRLASGIVGWLVVLTGVVSAATISHGFSRYCSLLIPNFPQWGIILLLVVALGSLAMWGIKESATTIMVMTIIEVIGLLMVITYGYEAFISLKSAQIIPKTITSWEGVFAGSFIAFYAFIGFEDMVNTSEETINPEKTMPRAIFLAILFATILYVLVAWVIVNRLPLANLVDSSMPMIEVIKMQGHNPTLFIFIAMIAIMNGLLVQLIMGSRLIYGMAKQENAPLIFGEVNKRTQTPIYATLLVMGVILLFAFALPIVALAKLTSTIMLLMFLIIQITLIKVKLSTDQKAPFTLPILFPVLSFIISLTFLIMQLFI